MQGIVREISARVVSEWCDASPLEWTSKSPDAEWRERNRNPNPDPSWPGAGTSS